MDRLMGLPLPQCNYYLFKHLNQESVESNLPRFANCVIRFPLEDSSVSGTIIMAEGDPSDAVLFVGISLVLGIACRHALGGTPVPYTLALLLLGIALGALGLSFSLYFLTLYGAYVCHELIMIFLFASCVCVIMQKEIVSMPFYLLL